MNKVNPTNAILAYKLCEQARELLATYNFSGGVEADTLGQRGESLKADERTDAIIRNRPHQRESSASPAQWICACGYAHKTGTYCGRCDSYAPGVTPASSTPAGEGMTPGQALDWRTIQLAEALFNLVSEIRAYNSPECDDPEALGASELRAADKALKPFLCSICNGRKYTDLSEGDKCPNCKGTGFQAAIAAAKGSLKNGQIGAIAESSENKIYDLCQQERGSLEVGRYLGDPMFRQAIAIEIQHAIDTAADPVRKKLKERVIRLVDLVNDIRRDKGQDPVTNLVIEESRAALAAAEKEEQK